MEMLTWNNNTRCYEAKVDGHRIEVDGDAFAEAEQDMVKNGMSEQEAFQELTDPCVWMNLPMDGVYVDGMYKGDHV